ncbi:translocation protein TolB [Caulifigura coniformis]|uniref:Translocation protein TolB n=1 Tax=Caulifigura coniformis TaxID=2527983 RepID=A0A517SL47_9PLAN|nr:PD40 domain-containing protein [Caulifigura coniformis]QDT56838.1 translocation protein TolB [Caulifigura coniformis]
MRSVVVLVLLCMMATRSLAQQPSQNARPVNAFYVLQSDGGGWKKLFEVPEYFPCNSPRVTADGSQIAFDAWKSRLGESLPEAHVLTCRLDGTDLKDLGPGAMPSWSRDGARIACCRYKEQQGAWLMDSDGTNSELLDSRGWGIQWSPDGRSVAFTRERNEVIIRDVSTGVERRLFPEGGSPHSRIYWNMTWSADSTKLAMIADLENNIRELAIVDARGAEYGFERRIAGQFNPMLSWNSDGTRLIFPERVDGVIKLSEIHPFRADPSRPVPGIPAAQRVASGCWLPDGSKLIVLVTEP